MYPITRFHFIKFLIYFSLFCLWLSNLVNRFGLYEGTLLIFLSWSFFVLCMPIILEGFLISFLAGFLKSGKLYDWSMITWVSAVVLNVWAYNFVPQIYAKTVITQFLYHILAQPFPARLILLLCALGTFYSALFRLRGKSNALLHRIIGLIFSLIGLVALFYVYYKDIIILLSQSV